jgi:hypothetical protein
MHRSGSSALTGSILKYFEKISIGAHPLHYFIPSQPKGFFENYKILSFNDHIVKTLGFSWYDTKLQSITATLTERRSELESELESLKQEVQNTRYGQMLLKADKSIELSDDEKEMLIKYYKYLDCKENFSLYHDRLSNILETTFSDSNEWCIIKDPRIILLWPLYKSALCKLQWEYHIIVIDRHNSEISKSLMSRNPEIFDREDKAFSLCNSYKALLNDITANEKSLTVTFDNLINDPISIMRQIGTSVFNNEINEINKEGEENLFNFVDKTLKHHNTAISKINYVIATWSGVKTKRNENFYKWGRPTPDEVLKVHLQQLVKFRHTLSQITIMKPYCDPTIQCVGYYDIDEEIKNLNVPVVLVDCENIGYSNGQWLKSYEMYRDTFDYYIFIEDDYCPHADNFDELLLSCYHKKFSNNIGKLCGFAEGYPKAKHHFPLHYDSIVLLSQLTLSMLYSHPLWCWNSEPRLWLSKDIEDTRAMIKLKKKYIGGFNQINFSLLFTKLGIPLEDYADDYPVPYFEESNNLMYYLPSRRSIKLKKDIIPDKAHICVPIQFIYI